MRSVEYDQLKGQKSRLLVFNKKAFTPPCSSRLYNITQSRTWSGCKKPCSGAPANACLPRISDLPTSLLSKLPFRVNGFINLTSFYSSTFQLSANDEERKTLNQLLRMAIHQKLTLNQRLEEMEMASEMRSTPRRTRGGGARGGMGGTVRPIGFTKMSNNRDHP